MGEPTTEHVMEYVDESVRSAKESREVGQAAESVIADILKALEDGKFEATEIFETVSGSIDKFTKAVNGAELIDDEHAQDPDKAVNAWLLTGMNLKSAVFSYVKARKALAAAAAPADGDGA